jgi:MoaA/NifB/PqqE/SkfB family radical SAM enzyme
MRKHVIKKWIEAVQGKTTDQKLFEKLSKSYPSLTSVTFTRECPMGCKHCFYPTINRLDAELNNLERIDQAIEATRVAGTEDLIHVGRTLKAEHIPILKKYQDLGMSVNLIDNGMGARLILKIKKSGLYFNGGIDISIDGDKISHDLQRRPRSYDQAVEAVKKFREIADHISITATASAVNYNRIVSGLVELGEKLPFVEVLQITTTSPTKFQPQRMKLKPREMRKIFRDFEKVAQKSSKIRMLIYRLEDVEAILPKLKKYGRPNAKYISIVWNVGKTVVEFFPQSIVTAEEFAIDSNGRHILPFGLDWHLDDRPEEWEMRDDLILTNPDKSYRRLVKKYWQTMGKKIFIEEEKVFKNMF